MNTTGADIGNYGVKLDNGVMFNSTVKNGHIRINGDDIQVIYEGKKFTIGAKDGAKNIGMNKYKKLHYKLLMLTAIVKKHNENKKIINANVVTGVPITIFNNKTMVEEIENEIKSWKQETIIVDGVEKIINIQKVKIFCESAVVFSDRKKYANKKVLVIDIGGSTVDASVWDNFRLTNHQSYKYGTISLCQSIASLISDNEKVIFNPESVTNIIGKDNIRINQKIVNIAYINEVIQSYIDQLSSDIYQNFSPEEMDEIILVGGGSQLLKDQLSNEFKTASIQDDSGFANAKTYNKIGDTIWQ